MHASNHAGRSHGLLLSGPRLLERERVFFFQWGWWGEDLNKKHS